MPFICWSIIEYQTEIPYLYSHLKVVLHKINELLENRTKCRNPLEFTYTESPILTI